MRPVERTARVGMFAEKERRARMLSELRFDLWLFGWLVVGIEGVNDGFGSVAAMPPPTRLAHQVTGQQAPRLWGAASPGSLAAF